MSSTKRILLVGGLERGESRYAEALKPVGAGFHFHGGHVEGRGAEELRSLVFKSDLVVVLTDTNSHGAVHVARKEARRLGKPLVLTRRCSPSRLLALWSETQLAA